MAEEKETAEENKQPEIETKTEEEYILELKDAIQKCILKSAAKVNKSALSYMIGQKQWISQENSTDAEKFFTDKIPKVLSEELASEIYSAIGLSHEQNPT